MRRFLVPATAAVLLCAIFFGRAQGAQTSGEPKDALGELASSYMAAFNKGDCKALAAFWTPNGESVNLQGERFEGRAALIEKFKRFFAQHPEVKLSVEVVSLRHVGADTAILDVIPTLSPPLQGQPPVCGTLVLVKRDGQWLIDSARETPHDALSAYEHLKELEWMLGPWRSVSGLPAGVSLRSTCDWTMSKNFLIRSFTVDHKDSSTPDLHGTHVIAWDPHERRIRSWVFDSTGSFSQGLWTREGKRWTIEVSGVLADGSKVASTDVITLVDAGTYTYQSKNRTSDGQPTPDVPAIEIKRESVPAAGQGRPGPQAVQKILP